MPSSVCYLLMATLVGSVFERIGIGSPCRSSLHFLLWHDGDGDTAGRFGKRIRRQLLRVPGSCKQGSLRFDLRWWDSRCLTLLFSSQNLLLLSSDGGTAGFFAVAINLLIAIFGIVSLAASGFRALVSHRLILGRRGGLLAAAAVFFLTQSGWGQLVAFIVIAAIGFFQLAFKKFFIGTPIVLLSINHCIDCDKEMALSTIQYPPIAEGATAEIFAWDEDKILKLYHEGTSPGEAEQEAARASIAISRRCKHARSYGEKAELLKIINAALL